MLNRLRQFKKLWKLSNKSKGFLEKLDNETLNAIPDEQDKIIFLSDMTDEEYDDYIKREVRGMGKVYKKIEDMLNGRR